MGFGSQTGGGVDTSLAFQLDPESMTRLIKKLDQLVDKEAKKIIKKSINAALTPILKKARETSKAWAHDTGTLSMNLAKKRVKWDRRYGDWVGRIAPKNVSIEVARWSSSPFATVEELKPRMYNPVKYAHFTEFGTKHGRAEKKWLRSAIATQRTAALRAFDLKFRKEFEKTVNRLKDKV